MDYTLFQWLMFFFIYCFVGWIWECSYVSIRTKKLTNRGFMRGPFLPIYGTGAIVMLAVGRPLMSQPVLMFFTGMICASTLEYFTGAGMEWLFKVRYWDYSKCFLNLNGHICLKASLAWGFFTIGMNYYLHKPVEKMIYAIPTDILQVLVIILLIYFSADYSLSFKTAMDLREVIIAIEKFKEEVDRMERRVEIAIAFAEDSREQAKQQIITRIEEEKDEAKKYLEDRLKELEARMEVAKQKLSEMEVLESAEKKEHIKEKREEFMLQLAEFKSSHDHMKMRLNESAKRRGVLYRNMVRNNPLASKKFADIVDEIKNKVSEYGKKEE